MEINKVIKSSVAALFIFIGGSSVAQAQNSKNVAVKNFNAITVSSGIDLYLTQGGTESLTIKASDDLLKNVIVEQSGTSLTIKYKEGINWGRMFKNQSIKAYVNFKTLKALTASGGSDVFTQNTLKTSVLDLRASGGSDLKMILAVNNLTLNISGGSDADLKGSGENMNANATGGSDIDAFGYVVNYAKVTASGGSDVNYKGNASLKKTTSSKSGDVNHVN